MDAGTDQPSLARADIKDNFDNVNSIIDSFNISTHTSGDILVWDSVNGRFNVETPADNNTTYTISAVDSGSDAIIRLTDSDSGTDDVVLVAGSNITITPSGDNITIAATDTGITDVVSDTAPQLGGNLDGQGNQVQDVELINYKEDVYTLSYAATITPDVANGNVQKMSCTGDFTFSAFSNPEAGQSLTLIIDHNGAARTLTSTMLFAGGDDALSTEDTTDIMTVFYDGTSYYASIAKGFA